MTRHHPASNSLSAGMTEVSYHTCFMRCRGLNLGLSACKASPQLTVWHTSTPKNLGLLTTSRLKNILNYPRAGKSLRVETITYISCNHHTWPISVRGMNIQICFVVVVITWKRLSWKSRGHGISFQSVLTASSRGVPWQKPSSWCDFGPICNRGSR